MLERRYKPSIMTVVMNKHLKTAIYIANLLDNKFKVFNFRFGIDPLLGLIPGGGDLVSLLLSLYLVWIGFKAKIPTAKLIEMIMNTAVDFLVGLVPVLGDVADFTFKLNIRNLNILKQHVPADIIEGEVVE